MKISFVTRSIEMIVRIILFFVVLCGMVVSFAVKASAQINVQQVPSDSKDTYSFEVKNVSGVNLSLQNWGLFHDSSVLMHAPGFSFLYLLPNGSATVDLNKNFTDLNKLLKLRKINGKTVDEFIHIFPKKDQALLKDLIITGKLVWEILTKSGLPKLIASLVQTSPIPSFSPTPIPSPVPTPTPSITPTPQPENSTPPQPSPTPIEIVPSIPPIFYPSPIPSSQSSENKSNASFPSSLQLTALLACPEPHQHQWLKVFNSDNRAYEVSKWKLKNSKGKMRLISGVFAPNSDTLITLTSSFMSRSGDTISLDRPDGITTFSVSYPDCKKEKGHVFVFHDSQTSSRANSSPSPSFSNTPSSYQPSESNSGGGSENSSVDSSNTSDAAFSPPNLTAPDSLGTSTNNSSTGNNATPIDDPSLSTQSATNSAINEVLAATTPAENASATADASVSSASATSTMQSATNIGLILFILSGAALLVTGSISFYLWYRKRSMT